jgi:hypothetical protein
MTRLVACAVLLTLLLSLSGCGGDDENDTTPTRPAATSAPARTATAAPDATPSGDIRSVDLESQPDVVRFVAETSGEFMQERVLYADLTSDGIDEAVVPLASGGTLGDLGFLVLTPTGDGARELISVTPEGAGINVQIQDGKLVQTEPVPGPDDPECCPSMLRTTVYAWNGSALAIEDVSTAPNPDAG